MVPRASLLLALVDLIDRLPSPPVTPRDGASGGRPPVYSDRLFSKALAIMLVRNVSTVGGLLAILEQPAREMQALRARLTEHGRIPSRRTWERRLATLPSTLPARIGCLGPIQVVLAGGTPGCAIRPRVRVNQVAGGGRLSVAIRSSPLSTGQPNPLVRRRFGDVVNARVRFNGFPVAVGQSIDLPPNTTATELTVERAVPGQSTTVQVTVVDTCGDWTTLVGGGTSAGF